MKKNEQIDGDGTVSSSNWMLNSIIDAFEKHNMNTPENDELIKELAIINAEHGRKILTQVRFRPETNVDLELGLRERINELKKL